MGEYEIITSLARDFMDNKGYGLNRAIYQAIVSYRVALRDAFDYEFCSEVLSNENR